MIIRIGAIVAALLLTSCATATLVPDSEYNSESEIPLYRVWYGTNRKPADPEISKAIYSNERDDKIHYGSSYVEVPKSHKFGSVGSSWVRRTIKRSDDRLKFQFNEVKTDERFFADMRHKLATRKEGLRNVLVYIHGYNADFKESVIRAAQLGTDLKVEGVTALFSWPSKGNPFQYIADTASIDASEKLLEEFLVRILDESGAEEVHVLAHSMGNRGLIRSIERVAEALGPEEPGFGQIFLAAPDVDKQEFERIAAVYPTISERTTLYVSDKDLAIWISRLPLGYDAPRAGYYPPVTVVPYIDTVSVSKIDMTVLGHSYYSKAKAVLYDMYELLNHNTPPGQRPRLSKEVGEEHWEMRR